MARKQSPAQQQVVERVMHEFKEGELEANGRTVENPRQAIAIALREAGASRDQTPEQDRRSLRRTRSKERETLRAKTRAELYEEARRRRIPGRSGMSRGALLRALGA